jgi:shikimate dehydrogenase
MRCAVLGDPIEHSLSPVLHRAGYAAAGLDWEYDARRVPSGGLAAFLAGLDDSWRGLSLTMPLKREAVRLTTSLTPTATVAGAANTLLLGPEGPAGDNTDVPGAVKALVERGVAAVGEATILGGGATATSCGLALADLGARSITVLVRDRDRAAETAARVSRHPGAPEVHLGDLGSDPAVGDAVVSTIPADAQDAGLVDRCSDVPVVFDVVYDPWPTPLAASAGDRTLVSGLDLLLHQAALQFELFTGVPGPLAEMRRAGEEALR